MQSTVRVCKLQKANRVRVNAVAVIVGVNECPHLTRKLTIEHAQFVPRAAFTMSTEQELFRLCCHVSPLSKSIFGFAESPVGLSVDDELHVANTRTCFCHIPQ